MDRFHFVCRAAYSIILVVAIGGCGGVNDSKTESPKELASETVENPKNGKSAKNADSTFDKENEKASELAAKEKAKELATKDREERIARENAKARLLRRAKAEAETAAKNQANRREYEVEVEKRKAEHQESVEQYKADKESVEQSISIYSAAKKELDAAKKLGEARAVYESSKREDASKLLKDIAQRQFREIIKVFPETQAAKDAGLLLKGEYVVVRKLPPLPPAPAEMPKRPQPLVLPAPPVELAVVYPPEPEEIAAEAARIAAARKAEIEAQIQRAAEEAKAEAAAEIARKAREELDFDGLVVLLPTLKGTSGQFSGEITGIVVNRPNRTLRYAEIRFNLLDDSGAQVGSALANINDLEAGGRWSFRAVTLRRDFAQYKVTKVSGY